MLVAENPPGWSHTAGRRHAPLRPGRPPLAVLAALSGVLAEPPTPVVADVALRMDHRSEVREFLRSRRAKLTPGQANLIGGA